MNILQNTETPSVIIFILLNKLENIEPDIRELIFDSILPLISVVNGKFYPPYLERYYEEYSEMTSGQKIIFNNKSLQQQVYLVNHCRRNTNIIYNRIMDDEDGDED